MTTHYTRQNPLPGWQYSRRLDRRAESPYARRVRLGLAPMPRRGLSGADKLRACLVCLVVLAGGILFL